MRKNKTFPESLRPQLIILICTIISSSYLGVIKFFNLEDIGLVIASVIALALAMLVIAGGILIQVFHLKKNRKIKGRIQMKDTIIKIERTTTHTITISGKVPKEKLEEIKYYVEGCDFECLNDLVCCLRKKGYEITCVDEKGCDEVSIFKYLDEEVENYYEY